jgi:hypothetical protein
MKSPRAEVEQKRKTDETNEMDETNQIDETVVGAWQFTSLRAREHIPEADHCLLSEKSYEKKVR